MTTLIDRKLTCRTYRAGQVYVHPRTHATVHPEKGHTHLACELCEYVVRLPDRTHGVHGAEEVRRRRAVAASAATAHELSEAEFARLAHETLYGRVERCPGCGGWKDSTRQCVTCALATHRRGDRCSS